MVRGPASYLQTPVATTLVNAKGSGPSDGTTSFFRAEGKRFELLVRGYRTLVFKTSSIGRSDNLPYPSSVS